MGTLRKNAINEILSRKNDGCNELNIKTSSFFGESVFCLKKMRDYVPEYVIERIEESINRGQIVDSEVANIVAVGMKNWAMSKGATHYTHWFQPLTGGTAEKHDAFLDIDDMGNPMEVFCGKTLAQQETDASSFPNGGIRDTFEARGYSAWDTSSPAFILDKTLCIPTIFISYTGEALDYKAPLLKSLNLIDKASTEIAQYVDKKVSKVSANLGWEQEYFLVDEALYNARPDLVMAGRTLFGHDAAKGQQLDDHYFGIIPERVLAFMSDFEVQAWKLGIPVKTRHNEVAPNQFELAAKYEEVNLSNDHNQLAMFILQKTAKKHKLRVLLHEKPFNNVNGSGKHNNWSLSTNTGINLLSPGSNPKSHLLFLTFFINTIKAFDQNSDLLRAAVASAGNDFRLGANEAPPAIMSVFIGTYLQAMMDEFVLKVGKEKFTPQQKTEIKLNIVKIPPILLDNTDRNRTSPFAFTGNKFEFRAVGSSDNCAAAMIALNTAVANQLIEFKKEVDELIEKSYEKDEAMYVRLKEVYLSCKNRIFNGNGYSDEWAMEAQNRGFSNINNTPEALSAYISKKSIKMFETYQILMPKELHARYEIKMEKYFKNVQIESRVMGDLVKNHIIPVALKYQNLLLHNVRAMKEVFEDEEFVNLSSFQKDVIKEISSHINKLLEYSHSMVEERKIANKIPDISERALAYRNNIFPYFDKIRYHADKLELIVGDDEWTLPKYRELLFLI